MKILILSTVAICAILTTSCNTFIGMGRDIRLAGEGLESAAHKNKTGASNQGSQAPENAGGAPVY